MLWCFITLGGTIINCKSGHLWHLVVSLCWLLRTSTHYLHNIWWQQWDPSVPQGSILKSSSVTADETGAARSQRPDVGTDVAPPSEQDENDATLRAESATPGVCISRLETAVTSFMWARLSRDQRWEWEARHQEQWWCAVPVPTATNVSEHRELTPTVPSGSPEFHGLL